MVKKAGKKRIRRAIAAFFIKITAPIRTNSVWKFLRKWVLRSPFRGYFINSWRELKFVTWPSRKTSWKLTIVVILFSTFFALFTTGLDWGFERIAKHVFLK